MKYNIAEKFVSINGEGQKAGELSVFIRFAGCNLNCHYCDTKWANDINLCTERLSSEEILKYILRTKISNITITGGEPLIQKGIFELLALLSKINYLNIEIETNGSVDLTPFIALAPNISYTMDYKTYGSGMESFMCLSNFNNLRIKDTIKFVITDYSELDSAKNIIFKYNLLEKCKVFLSTVYGKIQYQDIINYMINNHLNGVVFQVQLHKIIWDPETRGK